MLGVGTCSKCDGSRRRSLVLGFCRAKINRDRDLGRVFDRPKSRTIVTRVSKAISRWELRPRCRRRKIRSEATIFFEQADPVPPAERVVAFAFSHDGFRARPPAPFYRLAGPATWDACSIARKDEDYRDNCHKSGAGEITEWRRGVGLRSPTSGAEFPLRDGLFSVLRGLLPLQTACRCVCRGGRIGHVRYRISRRVRYGTCGLSCSARLGSRRRTITIRRPWDCHAR